jgi:hypothetical protein
MLIKYSGAYKTPAYIVYIKLTKTLKLIRQTLLLVLLHEKTEDKEV